MRPTVSKNQLALRPFSWGRCALWIVLFNLVSATSYAPADSARCGDWLSRLLQRDPRDIADTATIGSHLAPGRFANQRLIRELEKLHVAGYQSRDINVGKFDPTWIFRNPDALKLLLESDPDAFWVSPLHGGPRQWKGIEGFIDRWEDYYVRARGRTPRSKKLSGDWDEVVSKRWYVKKPSASGVPLSGRDRFLQRLMIEMAYHYQGQHRPMDGQPTEWTQVATDVSSFLANPADLMRIFPGKTQSLQNSIDEFQRRYNQVARQRQNVGTPWLAYTVSPPIRATQRALRRQGASRGATATHPVRGADERSREQQDLIRLGAQAIFAWDTPRTRLVSLVLSSTNTEGSGGQVLVAFDRLQEIRKEFGGMDAYIKAIQEQLGHQEEITLGPGAENFDQELALQIGVHYADGQGGLEFLRPFGPGGGRDAVFGMSHEFETFVTDSGLTLPRYNQFIRQRLGGE